MRPFLLAALLALSAPVFAGEPPKPPIYDDGIVVGPCDKNEECLVVQGHGCCDSCEHDPHVVKKGYPTEQACDCALRHPAVDGPRCAPADQAKWFKAVCKKHRCALERKAGAPPRPKPPPSDEPRFENVPF